MDTNVLPRYDATDNPTNCCPRFNPDKWDGQTLHFEDKPFLVARSKNLFHIPLNLPSVYKKAMEAIEGSDALDMEQCIVMSHDSSAWKGEHLFAVTKDVPDQAMKHLTGDFVTKVFEGPYRNARLWLRDMDAYARSLNKTPIKTYFFYTTCPKCAKFYGKNYVVGVTQVE